MRGRREWKRGSGREIVVLRESWIERERVCVRKKRERERERGREREGER